MLRRYSAAAEYAGKSVILSPADLAEAKRSVGAEGMHLIGFRSAAEIGRHLQLNKPARFMYPEVWTWAWVTRSRYDKVRQSDTSKIKSRRH
jgi:hypothetical protein